MSGLRGRECGVGGEGGARLADEEGPWRAVSTPIEPGRPSVGPCVAGRFGDGMPSVLVRCWLAARRGRLPHRGSSRSTSPPLLGDSTSYIVLR